VENFENANVVSLSTAGTGLVQGKSRKREESKTEINDRA
jgi:hypothetical protein